MNRELMFSSKNPAWETPQDFFDALNAEFHFTVDAAAEPHNTKCKRFFDPEENGLAQSWDGETVWCNPPYGRGIGKWVQKAAESKATTVMLLPARTDTKWFHDFINRPCVEIRFIKGRLKFGGAENAAPFPSMVVIFRNGG